MNIEGLPVFYEIGNMIYKDFMIQRGLKKKQQQYFGAQRVQASFISKMYFWGAPGWLIQ